jgi:preprotein translocase subunit SecD
MASPFFSGRIPQELSDRISQHCAETGESKTQVLINALSKYLDFPIKPPASTGISVEMFTKLEQRVAELEKKLEITTVSNIDNNVATEENKNANISTDNNDGIVKQLDNIPITNHTDSQSVKPVSSDSTQLSILDTEEQQVEEVAQGNRKPQIIKTNDVTNLPGLETMDRKKVSQKLRNVKASGKREVRIGQYLLRHYGKEDGTGGLLLWEVITDDNN